MDLAVFTADAHAHRLKLRAANAAPQRLDAAAVKALDEVGFDGVIRIDHCPGVIGDNPAADRSFAFQVGYLQGLVQALERLGD